MCRPPPRGATWRVAARRGIQHEQPRFALLFGAASSSGLVRIIMCFVNDEGAVVVCCCRYR